MGDAKNVKKLRDKHQAQINLKKAKGVQQQQKARDRSSLFRKLFLRGK